MVRLDWRGCGESGPASADHLLPADLLGLMDALGIGRAVLAGCSACRHCAARAYGRLPMTEGAAMTVLLAYVRTPEGDAALAAAVDEARRRATKAVVVNVTRPVAEVDSPMSAEQALDAAAALFAGAGVDAEVRQLPASSDRAGAILAAMSQIRPELVVIGMRKHTAVGELIIGSTSQRILRGAECPVLVVKAPTG